MSVKTKKRFKKLGKIIGIALFAFLMFTNIKISFMNDAEIASGDISILGIEMKLFDATYGEYGDFCSIMNCNGGTDYCAYGTGPNGSFTCYKHKVIYT